MHEFNQAPKGVKHLEMVLQKNLCLWVTTLCLISAIAQQTPILGRSGTFKQNTIPTICQGDSVILCLDSFFKKESICDYPQISVNLKNGLIGYWPFCGDADDKSGNGKNGVVFGSTLTSDRFGNPNNAYFFNGTGNYIICPGGNSFTSPQLTISYWLNVNNYNATSEIICLGNTSSTYWGAVSSNSGTGLEYGTGCGATSPNLKPSTNFAANQWYNVVLVSDRVSQNTAVYINGIFIGNNIIIPTVGCQNSNIYFGVDIFSNPEYFTGKLDDIEIWNRTLSFTEIQEVYSQGTKASWLNGVNTNCITVSPMRSTYYYFTVNKGISINIDSIKVTVLNSSSSFIDKTICQGQSYLGHSSSGIFTDTLLAVNGCDSIRTLNLNVLNPSSSIIEKSICQGLSYLGHSTSGIFVDTLISSNGCDSIRLLKLIVLDTCDIYFPSGFTPNNDHSNDLFKILNASNLKEYVLSIFNRWGEKIFETKDYKQGWDGMYKGILQPSEAYIWTSRFIKNHVKYQMKGTVVLIR